MLIRLYWRSSKIMRISSEAGIFCCDDLFCRSECLAQCVSSYPGIVIMSVSFVSFLVDLRWSQK